MNAVVDTNVVAYYLLGSRPYVSECQDFWNRVAEVWAPASCHAEILSVLWMAVRKNVITREESLKKLHLAAQLRIQVVPVRQLWRGALIRATRTHVSPYDTLF